jgi:hypothetical protein
VDLVGNTMAARGRLSIGRANFEGRPGGGGNYDQTIPRCLREGDGRALGVPPAPCVVGLVSAGGPGWVILGVLLCE